MLDRRVPVSSSALRFSSAEATPYTFLVALDRETVLHIARLARIDLTDEEVAPYQAQLSEIIGHFDVLNAIDTDSVEPTAQILPLSNIFAADVSRPSLPREEVLALAPLAEEGYLRVRAVLE